MLFGNGSGVGFALGGWLGMLGMIAVVIGVVLLIVWLVGRVGPTAQHQAPEAPSVGHDALELLRLRFARGETTEDEFRAARQVLEEGR